jgi:hypothetical protein
MGEVCPVVKKTTQNMGKVSRIKLNVQKKCSLNPCLKIIEFLEVPYILKKRYSASQLFSFLLY